MMEATATRLMESIAADRLAILCGAGLSMAPPSRIPGAADVAVECAAEYRLRVGTPLPPAAARNLETMAQWFREENRFDDLFIPVLVPWARFNTTPNAGHDAIADFLACGVVRLGITTNFDCLVENAARALGEPDFLAIIDKRGLPVASEHRPFLKAHGCSGQFPTRLSTIWCADQLNDASIRDRMHLFRIWLQANLLDRDLLIVGFWSDWAYLNEIFVDTLTAIGPRSVILVDPDSPADLESKAPQLWAWAHNGSIQFHHERESGAEFLNQLRLHFSRVFLRHVFENASPTYRHLFGEELDDTNIGLTLADVPVLYALRRDLTGVPRNLPVRAKSPRPEDQLHAALHARLLERGAVYHAPTYSFQNRTIRLINGAGQLMSQVKHRYDSEPPLPLPPDDTVCVGAIPDSSPGNLVRPDQTPDIIRGGVAGAWTTQDDLLRQLGACNG